MLVVQGKKWILQKQESQSIGRLWDPWPESDASWSNKLRWSFHVFHNKAFAEHQQNELKRLNISLAFESWRGLGAFIENGQLKSLCTSFQRLFLAKCKNHSQHPSSCKYVAKEIEEKSCSPGIDVWECWFQSKSEWRLQGRQSLSSKSTPTGSRRHDFILPLHHY